MLPFFLPGLNTLSFVVGNADTSGPGASYSGPTGLHVSIGYTDAALIPEPASGALLAGALLALGVWRRHRRG